MIATANDPSSPFQLIWCIVAFSFALRAFRRLRDPEWNGKAALSLGLTTSVMTVVIVAVPTAWPPAMIGAALLAVMVLPAALVISILAVRELRRTEPRPKGMTYAIWSLVLIGLLGSGGVSGALNVIHKQTASAIASFQTRIQPPEGTLIERQEVNLRVRMPRGWKQLEAKRLNKDATLGFGRETPETYAMIIAEDSQGTLDTAQLAAVWRGLVESKGATVAAPEPLRIGGFDGLRMHATLRQGAWDMAYSNWVVSRRGFLYQVTVWSRKTDENGLDARAAEILQAFEQLDPLRESSQLMKPVGPFRSAHFGYSVDLGPSWSQWRDLGSSWPSLEFGALCGSTDGLGTYAVSLAGEKPSVELLADGMLERIGLPRKAPSRKRRPLERPGFDALETEQDKESDGVSYRYRAWTLRSGDSALTFFHWTTRPAQPRSPCDGALEKFVVDPHVQPASPPNPAITGVLLNQFGVIAAEDRDWERAIPWYRKAQAIYAADDHFVLNEADALRNAGRAEESLAVLDRALSGGRALRGLPVLRARVLAQLGRTAEAHAAWAGLFRGGLEDTSALEQYATSLDAHGQLPEAIQVAEEFSRKHDSLDAVMLASKLLMRKGEAARALELLKARRTKAGFEARVAWFVADAHLDARRYAEALEEADGLIAHGFDSADAHFLRARAQTGLRWYPKAKAELEEVLRRDPADAEARRYYEHVQGLLGQGNSALVKESIPPVEIPADLIAVPAQAPQASAVYLVRGVAIEFRKDKPVRRSDLRVVRVSDQVAVDAFSTLEFGFDPLAETIFVNRVQVRDAAGQVVSEGKPEDSYVLDARHSSSASQRKSLFVPVQGLRPGATLEVLVTRRDLLPSSSAPFTSEVLASYYPIAHGVFALVGDVASIRSRASGGFREFSRPGVRAYVRDGIPEWREEPMQPPATEYLPAVWTGDVAASWSEEGKDYLATIADRLTPAPELKATALAHLPANADESAKISALATFVQRELTYRAVEFGKAARVPHLAPEVLRNRAGDCKDHALVLHQLLRAAGIRSSLALVRTGGKVAPDLPSLDQFDHMVVYVPGAHPIFLDATEKYDDAAISLVDWVGGGSALVLDGTPHLAEIPASPSGSAWSIGRQVRLEHSDLLVREHIEVRGPGAAAIRGWLDRIETRERARTVERALSGDSHKREVTSLTITGLDAAGTPLLIDVAYREKGAVHEVGGQLIARLPAPWEHDRLAQLNDGKRETPAVFRVPLRFHTRTELTFAQGGVLAPLKPAIGNADGAPRWKLDVEGRKTVFSFERPAVSLDPAAAQRWQAAESVALAAIEQDVALQPPEKQAAR